MYDFSPDFLPLKNTEGRPWFHVEKGYVYVFIL